MRKLLSILCCTLAVPAYAHWNLDNDTSSLSFVSVKKEQIAEVHKFNQLKGEFDSSGKVNFEVSLLSVNTNIEIRDQRMRDMLFETKLFPKATFTTKLPEGLVKNIAQGNSISHQLSGQIDLHGNTNDVAVDVLITRVTPDKIIVSTLKPFIVKASDFNLTEGIDKLQEVAKLPGITHAVPVSFTLTFNHH